MSDLPRDLAEETVKSRRGFRSRSRTRSRSACKKANTSCKDRSFTEHLLGQRKAATKTKDSMMCWAEEMLSSSPVKPRRSFRSGSKKLNTLSKDRRKETTTMADLPRDLAEEVFSRLPLTSLRGTRCTCKKWNTLTKAESFFKKHIGEQASTELTVVMVKDCRVYLMALNLHQGVDPSITCQGKLTSLDNSDRVDNLSLVYHCDGLLLCIAKDFARFVVWNPYTSQTLWLKPRSPHPRLDWYSYAIGYENGSKSSCRSYKILRFVDPLGNDFVEYEIYDLSSNSWRVLDVTSDWHITSYARGVSLKGNTYWFARERYPAKPAVGEPYEVADFLICFDFTTERFGPRLGLPFHTGFECTATLSSVREEQLAVLFQIDNSLYMEIWVTTKIEPQEVSWNKLFLAVNMEAFLDFQFGMSQGSFFIDEENRVVVVFDKDTDFGFTRNIAYVIGEGGYFRQVDLGESVEYHRPFGCSYVPSLAQIKQ
ncbi:hypothetical protein Bca4012_066657 [Brassica carinata]|uniref:F-box domain-containing protein n=1 Tax=Brassica carinata TaxID=52824 RepID=A0A8X7VRY0_BRACI|nr:hypothetical protein Bca52824_018932 [Brassica carinata]